MPEIGSWRATLADGSVMTSDATPTFDRVVEAGGCVALEVAISGLGPFSFSADQAKGEELRLFTRRGVTWTFDGQREQYAAMPVVEIRYPDSTFLRTYFHPTRGVLLSRDEINL